MQINTMFLIFFSLGVFVPVLCNVQINTATISANGSQGGRVQLPCKVINKQPDDTVVWEFVDHNVTISTERDIRIEGVSKYEISTLQDSSSEMNWYLGINDLQFEDAGTYRCSVFGTNESVVHHVTVQGATPRSNPPSANFLDCCIERNVDPCIYPLCNRGNDSSYISVLFDSDCVDNNILTVLECGQGGRNVLGCCIRSNVSELCQNICEGWGERDGTDYSSCVGLQTFSIAACYDEAFEYLPSQPTAISAVSTSGGFIALWQPPLQKADAVTKYRVRYRPKNTVHYNTISTGDASQLSLEVPDLMENTMYEFQVIAVAGQGASQPSYTVDIAVRGEISSQIITETIYDCCVTSEVSDSCIEYCSANTLSRGGNPDSLLSCFPDLEKIYNCLAIQGNHTPCCSRLNVPPTCFPLCEGRVNLNWNISLCMLNLHLIEACILEGSTLLPSPPYNTRIVPGSITSSSVTIAWDDPTDFVQGDYYTIAWRLHSHSVEIDWNTVSVVVGNSYTITGLAPAEIYDAVVASENSDGSSLPELTLVFVTEATGYDNQLPYNETACCIDNGVPSECLSICDHDFRLTNAAISAAFACETSVLPMLQCASDGRNHTDCCIRRDIPDICLPLCSLHPKDVPSTSFIQCALYKDEMSYCFDEGKGVLPNMPMGLIVKDIEEHSITLDWQKPAGPAISTYTVQYSVVYLTWTESAQSNHTFKVIDGLDPDTTYYFRVYANNAHGTSLPSEVIVAYTLEVPLNPNTNVTHDWEALWQDRAGCCSGIGISTDCVPGCNNGNLLDKTKCIDDLDKIIACGSDGKDHTECCKRLPDFPDACLPFCAGIVPPQDVSTALCLSYFKSIFTCFSNGQGLLPSPPTQLRLTSNDHAQISVQWEKPSENCESLCMYEALLWQEGSVIHGQNVSSNLSNTFIDLIPETEYRISAIASNGYGSSLPAPYIIVRTTTDLFFGISVSQFPQNVISSGESVQLECTTRGRAQWYRNGKVINRNNAFTLDSVTKNDEGIYSCMVQFDNTEEKTKDLYLNVRYAPVAESMSEDTVLPELDQDARIYCSFRGFPDNVDWFKEGSILTNVSKYLFETLQTDLEKGTTTAVLRVRSVTNADYGTYACTGENMYGNDTITGKLQNLTPSTPIPAVNTSVAECCDNRGVSAICSSAICTFALDLNNIIYDTSLLECLNYFEDFIACGTDGKDHSVCCESKGVSEYCSGFCSGQVPEFDSSWELVVCLEHMDDIGNCLTEGIEKIPTPPENFRASIEYDSISVTWEKPTQNADKVNKYDIYFQPDNGKVVIESVSSSRTQYYLPVTVKGVTYTVWGRAVNNFGQSAETPKIQVPVTSLVPRKPTKFTAEILDQTSVTLKWQEPTYSNVPILGYKIIYWKTYSGRNTAVEAVATNVLQTRLVELSPNTMYSIVVVARSADGYGEETEAKRVLTGENPQVVTTGPDSYKEDDNQGKVGLAVGIVFAVIFMIAIGVVVVLFYRRKVHSKPPVPIGDSVAFENPSYGNRGGGASESAEGNQFQYSNLKEEQDHEQVHLSFGNTTMDSTTDTPATLDVTS